MWTVNRPNDQIGPYTNVLIQVVCLSRCFCKVKLGRGATTHHCINSCVVFSCQVYLFIDLPSLLQNLHCWISQFCSPASSLTWYSICRTPQFCSNSSTLPLWNAECIEHVFFSEIYTVFLNGNRMVIFTHHNERFTWCSLYLVRWYAHCLVLASSLFRTGQTHAVERRQRKSEAPGGLTGCRLVYSDLTWTSTESLPSLAHTRQEWTKTRPLSQYKTCIWPLSQSPQDRREALWVENRGKGFLEEIVFASNNIAPGCVPELPVSDESLL